jgi:hypothetical protein
MYPSDVTKGLVCLLPFIATAALAQSLDGSPNGWSFGHSSHSLNNRFELNNVPLSSALTMINNSASANIVVSDAAFKAITLSNRTVSLTARDLTIRKMLEKIVSDLGVMVEQKDGDLRLILTSEIDKTIQTCPLSVLIVRQSLARRLPLHFDHVPVTMVLQFIEGFSGVRVRCTDLDNAYFGVGPMVTIHSENDSLETSLKEIAGQLDREVQVDGSSVVLAMKTAH